MRSALLLAAGFSVTACSEVVSCNGDASPAVRAEVTNGIDADGKCNVSVEVSAGSFNEQLGCWAQAPLCVCVGAWERPGTYVVMVTRKDGASAQKTVTASEGDCGVEPATAAVSLPQ